jgi:hypothetical protein
MDNAFIFRRALALEEQSMKVFGFKEMVIQREENVGNGAFRAGSSQMVTFVMEPLTRENWNSGRLSLDT